MTVVDVEGDTNLVPVPVEKTNAARFPFDQVIANLKALGDTFRERGDSKSRHTVVGMWVSMEIGLPGEVARATTEYDAEVTEHVDPFKVGKASIFQMGQLDMSFVAEIGQALRVEEDIEASLRESPEGVVLETGILDVRLAVSPGGVLDDGTVSANLGIVFPRAQILQLNGRPSSVSPPPGKI